MSRRRSVAGALRKTIGVTYSYDYAGTNGAAWASPWTAVSGTVDIQSGKGRTATTTTGYASAVARYDAVMPTDFELRVDATATTVTAGEFYGAINVRAGSTTVTDINHNSSWHCRLAGSTGAGLFQLYRINASGAATFLVTGTVDVDYVQGSVLHVRIRVVGNVFKGRCWKNAETEPSTWQIDFDDGASAPTGTSMSLCIRNGGSPGADRWDWDDINFVSIAPTGTPSGTVARTLGNVTATTSGSGASGGIHWGYDITQENYTAAGALNSTAKAALASVPNAMVATHIGGFGIYPPETSNNVFDWGGELRGVPNNGLDDGVQHVRDFTGATGVNAIILCSSPGWMKDSGLDFAMEEAMNAANEQNFADLCANIVNRYTDVDWFPFWNELKGMYNSTLNRWDYEKYVSCYNKAWASMKAARSTVKIGGPYVVSSSWSSGAPGTTLGDPACTFNGGAVDGRALDVYSYFRDNATGWDFIAADIWVGNQFGTQIGAASNLLQLDKFVQQINWIRDHIEPLKPIVIAEAYPVVSGFTQTQAEDMVIDLFELLRDNCDVQQGIWFLQWGESDEPPIPFDYTTGAATGLISKLQAWEAAQ